MRVQRGNGTLRRSHEGPAEFPRLVFFIAPINAGNPMMTFGSLAVILLFAALFVLISLAIIGIVLWKDRQQSDDPHGQ